MKNLVVLLSLVLLAGGLFLYMQDGDKDDGGGAARASTMEQSDPAARPSADLVGPGELEQPDGLVQSSQREVIESSPRHEQELAPEDADKRVTGLVVDELGNPIADARVIATKGGFLPVDVETVPFWMSRVETKSDSRGRFVIEGINPTELRVGVRASGYAPLNSTSLELPDEDEVELDPLVLQRGIHLSGRVLDSAGLAVSGAKLHGASATQGMVFFGQSMSEPLSVTDDQGYFRVDTLAAGPWAIQVEHPAHPSKSFNGVLSDPGAETGSLEFLLEEGALIRGRVVGIPAGTAARVAAQVIADEMFFSSARYGEIDTNGDFVVEGLEEGQMYSLQLREESEGGRFFGRSNLSTKVRANTGETGVLLEYLNASTITLRVLDGKTGEPIESMRVQRGIDFLQPLEGEDGDRTKREFPNGMVTVGDIRLVEEDDVYQLEINAAGYEDYSIEDLRLAPGQALDLGDISLTPVPVYEVTVLDATTRAPIEGARVTAIKFEPPVESAGAGSGELRTRISASFSSGSGDVDVSHFDGGGSVNALSGEDGVATMNALGVANLSFSASAKGYAKGTLTGVQESDSGTTTATLLLSKGGSVLVTVLEADGTPAGGKKVEHRSPAVGAGATSIIMGGSGSSSDGRTNAKGEVLFDNLELGVHNFRLAKGGGPVGMFGGGGNFVLTMDGMGSDVDDSWTSVEVVEGETVRTTLTAPEAGSLVGRVTEGGTSLVGASLSLEERAAEGGSPFGGMRGMPGFGGGGPKARSGGSGDYTFEGIEVGEYTLSISHATRQMPMTYPVEIKAGENSFDVDLPLSILAGRVTNEAGEPVVGAAVSVVRASEGTAPGGTQMMFMVADGGGGVQVGGGGSGMATERTDANGNYILRGVLADTPLQVSVDGGDFQPLKSDPITVGPNETMDGINLEVAAGGSIALEVFTADGDPFGMGLASAAYMGTESEDPQRKVIQDGEGMFTGLRPGTWEISIRAMGFGGNDAESPESQTVVVRQNETAELRFDMP